MNNWFDIIRPHDDIVQGNFDESVFAADLGDVHGGRAAPDYQDPYRFFKKTYLTQGLGSLLNKVQLKLTEGKGPGVVELQTPFGGGKTHAQIAVYHYVKHGKQIQPLLPKAPDKALADVCVIVGAAANPAETGGEDESGNIRPRTMWGKIALDLGGPGGYRVFENNDKARVAPGEDLLRGFLGDKQPFLLLLDEILDYVTRARGVRVGDDSSLAAQTLTFFQQLTNVVAHLDEGHGRGLLIATLPASEIEVFGEREEKAESDLAHLDKIFGRLEAIETPVHGEEIYSIIKRRLFDYEGEDKAKSGEVIDAYLRKYRECQHLGQVLPQFVYQDYRSLLEKSYPFHPETIDVLYQKWGSFPKFQRTRGVLRLLANVLEDLYNRETNIDLILPGDVNLGYPATREEFIKHIGRHYVSIIGSDISDGTAKAQVLDSEHRAWRHLAERISNAIFLNSFSGDIRQRGTGLPRIRLGVVRPDTETALVSEVVDTLSRNLWYLSTAGDSYYFSDIPNLNRMIVDMKENVMGVGDQLKELLETELRAAGVPLKAIMWPNESGDVADTRDLKVAVIREPLDDAELDDWVQKRGLFARTYKNTVLFAVPNADGEAVLLDKVKEVLALDAIEHRFQREEGSGAQRLLDDVRKRRSPLKRDLPFLVRQMYRTVLVPGGNGLQTKDFGKPLVDSGRLIKWLWEELTASGTVLDRPMSSTFLSQKFYAREEVEAIPTMDLLEQFFKEPSLPMLANEHTLKQSLAQAVRKGDFGLIRYRSGEPDPSTLRYEDDTIQASSVVFDEETYLITRDMAERLKPAPPGQVRCVAIEAQAHGHSIVGALDVVGDQDKPARGEIAVSATAHGCMRSLHTGVVAEVGPGETREVRFEITGAEPGTYTVTAGDQKVDVVVPDDGQGPDSDPHEVHFRISGVRAARIADFARGVLMPLGRFADHEVTFTVDLDLESVEGFDRNVIDTQVKETIRQIGARIEREDVR